MAFSAVARSASAVALLALVRVTPAVSLFSAAVVDGPRRKRPGHAGTPAVSVAPSQSIGAATAASTDASTVGRTLLTLDVNHDGVVDRDEVAAFARGQGLDVASVTQEFMEIDTNGDGRLDANEISKALSAEASASTEAPSGQIASASARTSAAEVMLASPVKAPSAPAQAGASASGRVRNDTAVAPRDLHASSLASVTKQTSNAAETSTLSFNEDLTVGSMAWELSQDEAREEEARRLEERVSQLRSNASAIAKAAAQKALQVGATAARKNTLEVLQRVQELEDGAQKADVTAAALQKKSQEELEEAGRLMEAADAALKGVGL